MVTFESYKGNVERILKNEFARYVDLVVEGGIGTNISPLCMLRDSGYSKPYVRMDLHPAFRGQTIDAQSQNWTDRKTDKIYGNFWDDYGNCFLSDSILPVIKKFKSITPAFITNNALVNALFDDDLGHFEGRKNSEDIVDISTAVKKLSEIYTRQLHFGSCAFGIIMSDDYLRKHRDKVSSLPNFDPKKTFNPMTNLIVWDERDVDLQHHWLFERFKQFIGESEKAGWKFYLPTESYDVLFMKKS